MTAISTKQLQGAFDCARLCDQRLQASEVFFGHGVDNAVDEAITLVCHVLGLARTDKTWSQQRLDADQFAQLEALLQQRIEKRVPLAYLIGYAWFAGLRFKVDARALVPRSPIAELIEDGFELWFRRPQMKLLDLCTGGGCLAIASAIHLPEASVDASDLSPQALELAAENVRLHGLEDRVRLHQSDLFAQLGEQRYDLIISNPPYVGVEEMASLPPEYLQEPKLALASGCDGLDLPLKILRDAARYLEQDGVLIMEVGNSDELLQMALPMTPFVWLEFEHGGHGVLFLDRQQLQAAESDIVRLLGERQLSSKGAAARR